MDDSLRTDNRQVERSAERQQPSGLEFAFSTLTTMLLSGAVVQLAITGGDLSEFDGAVGHRWYQVLIAASYLTATVALWWRRQLWSSIGALGWPPLAIVLLSFASVSWSVMPQVTLQRSIGLAGTILLAAFFARRFSLEAYLRVVCVALVSAALLGIVGAALWPEVALHQQDVHAGSWRGVYIHKNVAGAMMALGAVACILAGAFHAVPRRLAGPGAVACALVAVMSGSRSAWLSAAVAVVVLAGLRSRRHGMAAFAVFILLGLPVFFAIGEPAGAVSSGLQAIDRDETLTGRLPLWSAATVVGAERPLIGHGYRAFWFDEGGAATDVWREVRWMPRHAHNSAVEMWLDLGIVGLVLLLSLSAIYVKWLLMSLQRARPLAVQAAVLGVFVCLESLSDATIPGPNSLGLVIVLIAGTALRQAQPAQRRSAPLFRMTPDSSRSTEARGTAPKRHTSVRTPIETK